ncbi:hypothetical protein [Patiriisocius hiemis]|uniref:Anti-sigma factor n=1 Tax=Patiriisocius hiemis TaxID=3075604 RepID=A0ABU2YAF3_9FLAO|nr:hypothetical protein [Constantimarinum sp. W242]MDT0554717.1 hypothetical protein [Constantimarinum sp. W242]
MELAKVKKLLDNYFEGKTTLQEEKALQSYFTSDFVSPEVKAYKPLFKGFADAAQETSNLKVNLPTAKKRSFKAWYSVAAILLVTLTLGGIYFSQPTLSKEEQEALAAYQKAQDAMYLLSHSLNKGTQNLTYINKFEEGAENLAIINQFTKTKNKILK